MTGMSKEGVPIGLTIETVRLLTARPIKSVVVYAERKAVNLIWFFIFPCADMKRQ
jgi:hypothetical protein